MTLNKQLDKLWSKAIIARDNACRECNSQIVLQGHHIRSRRHYATRWLLDNGLTLCRRHHVLQKFNPERFHDMIIDIIGWQQYDRLRDISSATVKYSIADLQDIKERLKSQLGEL